jgi:hypothetical protein
LLRPKRFGLEQNNPSSFGMPMVSVFDGPRVKGEDRIAPERVYDKN